MNPNLTTSDAADRYNYTMNMIETHCRSIVSSHTINDPEVVEYIHRNMESVFKPTCKRLGYQINDAGEYITISW